MEWISVKDRLPEPPTRPGDFYSVLGCTEDGEVLEVHIKSDGSCRPPGETSDLKLTHWMPLPEPPKGGE